MRVFPDGEPAFSSFDFLTHKDGHNLVVKVNKRKLLI